jgi:carbon monoxide dehydrogenase subunit G
MTKVQQTIHVRAPLEVAFDYVADFSTTAEWDPGVAEASRLDVGPSTQGSRFRVVADFNGRKLPLEYTITAFDRPRRVVLVGDGTTFHGVDEINFATAGGGTMVTFTADLQLKGPLRITEPFMKGRFEELGRKAVAGLQRELDRRGEG